MRNDAATRNKKVMTQGVMTFGTAGAKKQGGQEEERIEADF